MIDLPMPRFENPKCANPSLDKDLFFPDSQAELAERLPLLREICDTCDHKAECLDYAITESIKDGVWGGFSPDQRKSFARKRRGMKSGVQYSMRETIKYLSLGWTISDIATLRGISEDSIRRQLARAKKKGLIQ